MIIHRPKEEADVKTMKKWTLVYGRRKTGKSFLVENFIPYDDYFFVNRDMTILSKKTKTHIGYDALVEVMERDLESNKTVVIDEFHRLGGRFLDLLHSMKKSGRVILLTSTLFLAKKLVSTKSPILGLFYEKQIDIISLEESLNSIRRYKLGNKQLLESAIMLREPITADYFDAKEDIRKTYSKLLISSVNTVPALIGEIFLEEERNLSATYEGIIRAVANGKVVSGEISSVLYSRGLISKDDPSAIQPYLGNLVKIGLLTRIAVYGKTRFVYKIPSPLIRLFFYADEKYSISERKFSETEAFRILDDLIPKIVEDNIREHIAYKFGLTEAIMEAKDYDIDGVLLRFKKPEIVLEVKWRNRIDTEDISKAESNLGKINAKRRLMFVPDKSKVHSDLIEIIDVNDL